MLDYSKSVPSYKYPDFVKTINNNIHGIYDSDNQYNNVLKKIGKDWKESWNSFLLVAGKHDDELQYQLNHRKQ